VRGNFHAEFGEKFCGMISDNQTAFLTLLHRRFRHRYQSLFYGSNHDHCYSNGYQDIQLTCNLMGRVYRFKNSWTFCYWFHFSIYCRRSDWCSSC